MTLTELLSRAVNANRKTFADITGRMKPRLIEDFMAKTGIAREAKLVGSRIHQMRKRAKMSVQHFAERTGYTPIFISQIEKGERKPSFEAIMRLAKALGVSPAAFFNAHAGRPMAKKLRQQIRRLLQRCSGQQLLQTYAVLNSMLER